jgi:hypothetical protein
MRRARGQIELLATGLAALCAVLDYVGGGIGLLYLAPAILIAALLLAGRYPGERVLARAVARVRAALPRRRRTNAPRPRPPRRTTPRGGVLLSAGLAGRGPPVVR